LTGLRRSRSFARPVSQQFVQECSFIRGQSARRLREVNENAPDFGDACIARLQSVEKFFESEGGKRG